MGTVRLEQLQSNERTYHRSSKRTVPRIAGTDWIQTVVLIKQLGIQGNLPAHVVTLYSGYHSSDEAPSALTGP